MTLKKALIRVFPLALLIVAFWISQAKTSKNVVWIYASIYKEVIAAFDEELRRLYPDISVQWYQSGSENVAARVNAELSSGASQADLIMTSDPFWYLELKESGHLLSYFSPLAQTLEDRYKDPEGFFIINRIPVGIIAYETHRVSPQEAPSSWEDLVLPRWKHQLSMPSPLESGTALSFILNLVQHKGWSFFEALKRNQLIVSGGNSSVMQRIETQETPVGIVLLENALQAQKRGAPISIVYPREGSILVPSPIAILSQSSHPEASKKIYDFFLTETAQKIFLKAHVYSPFLKSEAPEGAKPFSEIEKTAFDWNANILKELRKNKESAKKRFSEMLLK